ncbi:MAG: 2-C-methyl-D-erythritol 4-phosphate cytidylyltransferase [Bacillota bacterium]
MYRNLTVTAVVVAAGKGSRMNSPVNKQYLMLKDKPILAHTLSVFQRCDIVDHIVVVAARKDIPCCRQSVVEGFSLTKVKDILAGGCTRQQSATMALEYVEEGIVVIHDGVRPFVDCSLIERGVEKLVGQNIDGTACAVPVKDTVKLVDDGERVQRTLDRARLRAVQTPQCFMAEVIKEVHRKAAVEGAEATDDLALLEHYGYRVSLYPGRYDNIKITTPEDLLLAEVLMEGRDKT